MPRACSRSAIMRRSVCSLLSSSPGVFSLSRGHDAAARGVVLVTAECEEESDELRRKVLRVGAYECVLFRHSEKYGLFLWGPGSRDKDYTRLR